MPDDVEVADDSWRAALSESFDKVVASETAAQAPAAVAESAAPAETTEASPSPESTQESRERDEKGRFKPGVAAKGNEAPRPTSSGAQAGAVIGAPPPVAPAAPPAPVFKPPQSWKPEHREKWATLPTDVQAEITRREKEIAQVLQQRAEGDKTVQAFHETIRPYEAQIRAAGVHPQQYVGNLLRAAHALTYAPPQQKADLLASLTLQYGVPIEALDAALVARRDGQPQQQQQPMRDPRVDMLLQQQQQAKQQQAQAAAKHWESVVEKFADTHEHFENVGEAAADWIDLWKSQGKSITEQDLELAYQRACQDNEYVSKVTSQKKAAEAAATSQQATQRAKTAASSVRSSPGSASGNASPSGDGWRPHLEAAADKAGW